MPPKTLTDLPIENLAGIAEESGGWKSPLWQVTRPLADEAERRRELPKSLYRSEARMAHYELVMRFKDSLNSNRIAEAFELLITLLNEPESSQLVKDSGFFTHLKEKDFDKKNPNYHELLHDLQFDTYWSGDILSVDDPGTRLTLPRVLEYCKTQNKLTDLATAMLTHVTLEQPLDNWDVISGRKSEGYLTKFTSKPTRLFISNGTEHVDYILQYFTLENGPNCLFLRTMFSDNTRSQSLLMKQDNKKTEWRAGYGYHTRIAKAVQMLLVKSITDYSTEPAQRLMLLKASFADACLH